MFTLLTDALSGIFKMLVELLSLGFTSFSKKKGYTADFGSEGILLSRWNKGFSLTGRRQLSLRDSFMHCLVAGSSGSGKSQVTIFSTLFSATASFVVADPSGEIFLKTSGYLKQKGYVIRVLNFTDAARSAGYNLISRLKSASDIQKLSSLLIRASMPEAKDPFWTNSAISMLAVLIAILKRQPQQFQNMANLRHMLNHLAVHDEDGSNPIDVLAAECSDDPLLYSEYKSMIAQDTKLLSSVIATCKAALTVFADPMVARVTAADTIDFSELRKKRTVIYVQTSITDMKYMSVLMAIFSEQLLSYLLSRFPEPDEQPVLILMDEFGSMGKVPSMMPAFANLRKHSAGVMAVVQDFSQVVSAYGKQDADAIRSNCYCKIYFGGASAETNKELSETLGKYEYEKDGKKEIRPLLTNDQVRMLPPNRALLICGHHPPILARMRPAYKPRRYRAYMAIPAPVIKGDAPESIELLPLVTKDA